MLNLKKRLILDADINFDTAGTGEVVTFFGQDGKSYSGKKINASHMPLTAETRKKVAAGNVDQALSLLSDKVNNIAADDVLTSDETVVFEAEDAFDVIQDKINQQKKNLNGHTLTFVFPASLSQILYSTIIWQDFYNGTVKITGGTADRLISIYDQLDITALFRFYRCQCEVIVEYFHFIHQYSVYAIFAESSTAVIAKNCTFTGMRDVDSYAIKLQASGGAFDNCQFNDDIQLDVIYNTGSAASGHYLGEVFAYPGAVPPEGAYLLNGQTIPNCSETYKKFWAWVNTAGVRIIDNATFEAELASFGVCDGFVLDSSTGNVRLPKWKYQAPLGDTLPVRGNGMAIGFTNGTDNVGLIQYFGSVANVLTGSTSAYGAGVSSSPSFGSYIDGNIGLTTDPEKSGIVTENNAPSDHFVWCIQVFNAATALSEQESAQLASQMQMKAQTDLANVDPNVDFVVETWRSGVSWYRKYRSGWIEQGGQAYVSSAEATIVTLFVEMATTDYTVALTNVLPDTSYFPMDTVNNRTETTITILHNTSAVFDYSWYVCGQSATE